MESRPESDKKKWASAPPPQPREQNGSSINSQLNVAIKSNDDDIILFMQPQRHHCSTISQLSEGLAMQDEDLQQLKTSLRVRLKPKTQDESEDPKEDYLRVAVGNMLERIVFWDQDRAVSMEQDYDCKNLSMLPTIEDLTLSDSRYLIDRFRKGLLRLNGWDWRRQWATLDEETLRGLLRYTLLHARPVLAWELDLTAI
ncbi:uncharacterized protein KY384_001901 [Bacidia gigantensis]|uniref:uncharacterized protein n=1 Tax=Bacidia gigantensis TaxID=2732470 RepID=UPI001D0521C6|nr:uncharacterized protein KY384_001901 [Bacidia gigantensis]KAG8533118.1 hypothetical protein KY384_001901 [Bacidia gigantensis]